MPGFARMSEKEIECPFCRIGKVKTLHKESFMQSDPVRISGRRSNKSYYRPETYEVLDKCPNCGKTKKEIQKAIDTGKNKELTHEERIEMLKKRGLPLVLGSKT
jgi:uncharacterized protein (DUF2225 family)